MRVSTTRVAEVGGIFAGGWGRAAALALVVAAAGLWAPRALANSAPTAWPDSATLAEDTSVSLAVTANDTDPDGDTVLLALSPIIEAPTKGTAVRVNGSTIRYTPHANVFGTDRFRYRVHDGNGHVTSALVNLTITSVNDKPVAANDSASVAEDSSVTVVVTANDSDVDGDTVLLITSPVVTPPSHGTAVKVNGSSIVYTPHADHSGSDSFQYEVGDGRGARARAWVTLSVIGSNDPPVAQPDAASTNEDTAITLTVTGNDFDPDGTTPTLALSPIIEAPTMGTATRLNASQIRYTPHADVAGTDRFRYRITDGSAVDSALVTVTVVEVNDPPTAVADAVSTPEDTAVTVVVTANDSDVEGDALALITSPIVTAPAHGTAAKVDGSSIRYTPHADFSGSDTFRYEVGDNRGGRSRAWVTVTVVGANDPPVAVPDSATTNEDTAILLTVTANDSDPDGDPVRLAASPILEAPALGTATRLDDTRIRYVPNADAHGSDQLRYRIADGNGGVDSALVTLTVVEVNDAPETAADAGTTQMSTEVVLDVVANDSDVDGDVVRLIAAPIVTPPAHGTAVKVDGRRIAYTPETAFAGTDTFQYEVGDGRGARTRGWVTVSVAQPPSEIRLVRAWDGVEVPAGSSHELDDVEVGETTSHLFRIHNDGAGALEVRNHLALVSGACFGQIEDPAAVVPAGGSTTFRVRLQCASAQRATGTVTIETNDPDEPAYSFGLRGAVGLPLPPIRVLAPDGSEVPHQGVFVLPETAVGQPVSRLLTIVNDGAAPLGLAAPADLVSGTGFSEIEVPATPIAAGGQSAFRVRLLHGQPGSYTGQVVIEPTDVSTRSYRFALRGDVGHPDFELAVDPASRSIERGRGKKFSVTVTPRFGFSETVSLAVSGLPEGAMAWWSPDALAAGTASVTITTSLSTPLGSYPLTITGTASGIVHSQPATIHVWEPVSSDFALDVSPDAATVVQGGGVEYSVSLTADAGFSGTADISLSGLPAGVTHTVEPAAIGNGGVALISVQTLPDTVEGSYELTVTGVAGAETRTALATLLVRPPAAPGAPVIDAITPELLDGGGVRVVTLFGSNLQGSTVTVAQENPDAGATATRIFPSVVGVATDAAGTRVDVSLDLSDPRVMDFYNLEIDNGLGEASTPSFRVVPAGPVIDLVTPNRPEVGGATYVLTLAGYHLGNTTITAEPAGVLELIGVGAEGDRQINGLVRVAQGAGTGPVDLVVRDPQGRTARIGLQVVASGAAQAVTRRLATQRVDPESLEPMAGTAPSVLFQELAVRPINAPQESADGIRRVHATSLDRATADAFTFQVYLSYTVNLFNFYWARAFVFDPETGRIGDAILQGLGLGEKVRFGAFVLSLYLRVDLTIDIYFGNTGFTWPRFCVKIFAAVQIPGVEGFVEQWDYCRGGGFVPFNTGSTSDISARGGDCTQVTEEPVTLGEGIVYAEAEQLACCHQPIEVAAAGQAFTGTGFAFDFNVQTPNAGTATPGGGCQCSIKAAPTCIVKDQVQFYSAEGFPAGGSYQWRVVKGSDRVVISSGANSDQATVDGIATSAAADDVELEVTYTNGGSSCSQRVALSVVELDGPLELKISGTADPENDAAIRYAGLGVGMPQLGAVTPGSPAGTNGFHQNMQVKAKILPCDPALRCDFDFGRTRSGVVGLIRADGKFEYAPSTCPLGGCDDEGDGNNDEDLQLDPANQRCSVFVIDAPGFGLGNTSGTCPPTGQDEILGSCLTFTERLEIDEAVLGTLLWHAETRIRCDGSKFQLEGGTARNRIGHGRIDCINTFLNP